MTKAFEARQGMRRLTAAGLIVGGLLGSAGVADLPAASGDQAAPGPFDHSAASVQALTMAGRGAVYAGSFGHGIFRTIDRGATWAPVGGGVTDPFVLSLTTARGGSVYAGTLRGGVFRSRDDGKSWQTVNAGLKRLEVKALMATGDELYAGTGDGVYRLNEPGDRWSVVTTGLDDVLVHALARSADGTLYAGTSGKGILHFRRHSSGWVRVQHGLKDHEGMIENFIRVLVIDQDQSIFAGTFGGGVFRSVDGGATWRPISRALPNDSIRGIVLIDQGLIVATGNGIFRTVDKGKQWTPVNNGLTNLAIQVLIGSRDEGFYAGTSAGVFRSDDGLTWTAVNQGLEAGTAPPPFLFR
ncbi:MAG: ligand-binding sensor domain-containing protein [Nitrospiraceae bacterium]